MISNNFDWLKDHISNSYSQSGEDGVLVAIFEKLGMANGLCFEAGAADGEWISSTKLLMENGWTRILSECDPNYFAGLEKAINSRTQVHHHRIEPTGPQSIDRLFPYRFGLVVIDVDGCDYWIFKHLSNVHAVVMVEAANNAPDQIPSPLNSADQKQAGSKTLVELGREKGYEPVAEVGVNIIFVQADIAEKLKCQ